MVKDECVGWADAKEKGEFMNLSMCPRCGSHSYEYLSTHSHCLECAYYPEQIEEANQWYNLEFLEARKRKLKEAGDELPGIHLAHGLVL